MPALAYCLRMQFAVRSRRARSTEPRAVMASAMPLHCRERARRFAALRVIAPVGSRCRTRGCHAGVAVNHGPNESANQGDGTGLGDGLAVGVHEVHLPDVRSRSLRLSHSSWFHPIHQLCCQSANTFFTPPRKTSNRFISTLFHTGTKTSFSPSLLGVKALAQTTKGSSSKLTLLVCLHGAFHSFLIHSDAFIVQRNFKRIDKTIRHGRCVAFVDGDASPVVRTKCSQVKHVQALCATNRKEIVSHSHCKRLASIQPVECHASGAVPICCNGPIEKCIPSLLTPEARL